MLVLKVKTTTMKMKKWKMRADINTANQNMRFEFLEIDLFI